MNDDESNLFLNYIKYYYNNITPTLTLYFLLFLAIAITITFTGKIEKKDKNVIDAIIIYIKKIIIIFTIFSGVTSYALAYVFAKTILSEELSNEYIFNINKKIFTYFNSITNYIFIIPILISPLLFNYLFKRFIVPHLSAFFRKRRITQADNELSDIVNEINKLKPFRYDPTVYFKKNEIFIGLNENKKPIYIPIDFFTKNHLKIVGPTQTGKGVELGLLIEQFIMNGWGTWFNDVKPDKFVYPIMVNACKKYNRNLIVVDLTGQFEGMGYSPFLNGTYNDRMTRIIKALKIEDTGKTADFYLSKNRSALIKIFPLWDGELESLLKLLNGDDDRINEKDKMHIQESTENLRNRIQEWLMYDSVKAKGKDNFNVLDALKNNDVVYIRGSMDNRVIRTINYTLIEEFLQVRTDDIENRTFFGIDEARFMITEILPNSLATVLSKGGTLCLTYQARSDTANPVEQISNVLSIQNGIETNTQFSMYYRAFDSETAEWIAKQTGTVNLTVTKIEKVNANEVGAETWDKTRMLGREQQYLIPENVILSLPETVGIVIRPNHLAEIYYTSWIPVETIHKLKKKQKIISEKKEKSKQNIQHNDIKQEKNNENNENSNEDEKKANKLFNELTDKNKNFVDIDEL